VGGWDGSLGPWTDQLLLLLCCRGYVLNRVLLAACVGAGKLQGPGEGTLGALDLGGSSLEVTFAADSVPWQEDAGTQTSACQDCLCCLPGGGWVQTVRRLQRICCCC
jgi:hypothetical protein